MGSRVNGVFVVLTLMLSALVCSGCSERSQPADKANVKANAQPAVMEIIKTGPQPSDEEIIKAIDDSGIMKRADGSLMIVPPVTVVQKGKQDKGGTWPVKVKFTLKYRTKDGRTSPATETTTSFRIFAVKDSAGNNVWKARLGS